MTSTDTIENRLDVDIATPQPQPLSSIQPASPSNKSVRSCRACGHLCVKRNGPLVKALGEIYHYQCFVCEVQSFMLYFGHAHLLGIWKRRRIMDIGTGASWHVIPKSAFW